MLLRRASSRGLSETFNAGTAAELEVPVEPGKALGPVAEDEPPRPNCPPSQTCAAAVNLFFRSWPWAALVVAAVLSRVHGFGVGWPMGTPLKRNSARSVPVRVISY